MLSRDFKGERMPIRRMALPISQPKDKVPSSSDTTWEFVNISQPDRGKSVELRRCIRSNAMRHFHSEQRALKRGLERREKLSQRSTPLENSKLVLKESDGSTAKTHSGCQSLQPLADCVPKDAKSRYDRESRTFLYPCTDSALEHPTLPNSPYTRLGNGDSDPFNSLPVQNNQLDSRIFHHCKSSADVKPFTMLSLGLSWLPG